MSDKLLKRCPTCKGIKRIMGLGMMYFDCKKCNGAGLIADIKPKSDEGGDVKAKSNPKSKKSNKDKK